MGISMSEIARALSDDQLPKLKVLVQLTSLACDAAWHDESCKDDAINWGDFDCVGAEFYIDNDGETGYRVRIEEADPTCTNVHKFVGAYLAERGFANVEVRTEW
jgi:hypothetical protein